MSCKKNNVDYNVNMNETAKLLAYCVIILMITIGVFSLSYFDDETYNEEWYKKNSMIITAAVIITCFISLGGYFIRLAFGKKGGFLNPKMILFVAFLGYLFDWISLTNDITRFTEEDEYTWYGDKKAFITRQSGRVNSTITGIAAMLADVWVLYDSSTVLFGSNCKECYRSENYFSILVSLMVLLFVWSVYLVNKYSSVRVWDSSENKYVIREKEQRMVRVLLVVEMLILMAGIYIVSKDLQWNVIHVLLILMGAITIYVLNSTESKLDLMEQSQTPTPKPVSLVDESKNPSSIIPVLFYGNNMTRGMFNGIVIFLNILLGWQLFFSRYNSDLEDGVLSQMRMYNLVKVGLGDLLLPSLLNFINTSGQLGISSEDLNIPLEFDENGSDKNLGIMSMVVMVVLILIMVNIASMKNKKMA